MADTLREIGAQMANVMFNLAQRPGDELSGDHVATMDSLRKQWDAAVRATPPSPSTAPEVPPFPESFGLADVPHAMNTPDDWDADYRATWQKLQVAEINLSQMRAYARKLRAALASRPAEVDDEGLHQVEIGDNLWRDVEVADLPTWPVDLFHRRTLYTAEQYRQGQRDAVAADRARRREIFQAQVENGNWCDIEESALPDWESMQIRTRRLLAAPSHPANKENGQ